MITLRSFIRTDAIQIALIAPWVTILQSLLRKLVTPLILIMQTSSLQSWMVITFYRLMRLSNACSD